MKMSTHPGAQPPFSSTFVSHGSRNVHVVHMQPRDQHAGCHSVICASYDLSLVALQRGLELRPDSTNRDGEKDITD